MKTVIVFNGFCCDTGNFTRRYEFDTRAEAEEWIAEWKAHIDDDGIGYSDGYEEAWIDE